MIEKASSAAFEGASKQKRMGSSEGRTCERTHVPLTPDKRAVRSNLSFFFIMARVGRDVYIVEAVRTPVGRGRADGALHGLHPVELLSMTLHEVVTRANGTSSSLL